MARTKLLQKAIEYVFTRSNSTTVKAKLDEHDTALDALDGGAAGASVDKLPCRFATTANVSLATVGLTVTDGVTPVAGDRVFVWKQSTSSQNGIYVVGATAWTRATDTATSAQVLSGANCVITEGTLYGGCWGQLLTANPINLGTTNTTWLVTKSPISTGTDGQSARLGAAGNVIGVNPVMHIVTVADGTTVLDALTLDATYGKLVVTDVVFQKNANTGGATDAVQLCTDSGGSTAVSSSLALNTVASGGIVRTTVVTTANATFAAGAHFYVKRTHTTDCGGVLYVSGYRVA